jgi:hypothetical protein
LGVVVLVATVLMWLLVIRNAPGQQPQAAAPPVRPAVGVSIPYSQYLAAVTEALSHVREARRLAAEERTKRLERAAAALEKVEGVNVPSKAGGVAEVDNTAILAALREPDPDVEALERALALLARGLEEADTRPVPGTLGGEEARAALNEVLSDPAFDYENNQSPLRRLARWLSERMGEGGQGGMAVRWFAALLAGLAAGVLAYLASGALSNRRHRLGLSVLAGATVGSAAYALTDPVVQGVVGPPTLQLLGAFGLVLAVLVVIAIALSLRLSSTPPAPRPMSDLAAVLGMSAAEARKRAEEAAGAGDFRSAIRFRCLAVLLALDEAGMLTFDRTATDREYLFRAPAELQADLRPLFSKFEATWYGNAPADRTDWQEYGERAAQVEAMVKARAMQAARHGPAAGRSAA